MASADRQMIGDATLAPQGFRPGAVVSSVAQRLWLAYRAGIGFSPPHTPHPPPPPPLATPAPSGAACHAATAALGRSLALAAQGSAGYARRPRHCLVLRHVLLGHGS